MAKIYTKTKSDGSEKTLILSPREALHRPFYLGDWTEIRVGLFCTFIPSDDDNDYPTAEDVYRLNQFDRFFFGVKDATLGIPGTAGTSFIGCRGYYPDDGRSQVANGNIATRLNVTDGSSHTASGTSSTNFGGNSGSYNPGATAAYNGFNALSILIQNKGASNQQLYLGRKYVENGTVGVSFTDYTAAGMLPFLSNTSGYTYETLDWNDGADARLIPNSLFLYSPFYNNRIRISSMLISKVS